MFVGHFLGDALGAPHERRINSGNVYTGLLEVGYRDYNRFTKEETIYPPGTTTDDTEMTITLLRSLIEHDGFINHEVLDSYLDWAASGCKSMGTNTRAMLKGGKKGVPLGRAGYVNRVKKYLSDPNPSKGNGTLMRAAPLALLFDLTAAERDAKITNPNETNIECNRLYVGMLSSILAGEEYHPIESDYSEGTWRALTSKGRNVSGSDKGYVLHALWFASIAYWADLTQSDPYSNFIGWVTGEGGDTDTNAAIGGAVVGARLGFDAMMNEELTRENFNILLTSEWLIQRDRRYTVTDLDELIEGATALYLREHGI